MKHTPSGHVDFDALNKALDVVKDIADYVNQSKRESESRAKFFLIEQQLTGEYPVCENSACNIVAEDVVTQYARKIFRKRRHFARKEWEINQVERKTHLSLLRLFVSHKKEEGQVQLQTADKSQRCHHC